MDISTFYAVTAATCFTLVGLWWSVVKDKSEWFQDEVTRRLAGGVYASFLIPGLMSMAAQLGSTTQPLLWQLVFILAGGLGIYTSTNLMRQTNTAESYGPFSRHRWVVPALYGVVILFALLPGLARFLGLQPLQMEGLLVTLLVLIAHMLAWEFLTVSMRK